MAKLHRQRVTYQIDGKRQTRRIECSAERSAKKNTTRIRETIAAEHGVDPAEVILLSAGETVPASPVPESQEASMSGEPQTDEKLVEETAEAEVEAPVEEPAEAPVEEIETVEAEAEAADIAETEAEDEAAE